MTFVLSRAPARRGLVFTLAAVLAVVSLASFGARQAHASNFWGAKFYDPAMAWNSGPGGQNVSTVKIEYAIEEFPEGCRVSLLFLGFLNGGSWPYDVKVVAFSIEDSSGVVAYWGNTVQSYGSVVRVASPVASGLYQGPAANLIGLVGNAYAKGASEGTWHPVGGHSGTTNWTGTLDC